MPSSLERITQKCYQLSYGAGLLLTGVCTRIKCPWTPFDWLFCHRSTSGLVIAQFSTIMTASSYIASSQILSASLCLGLVEQPIATRMAPPRLYATADFRLCYGGITTGRSLVLQSSRPTTARRVQDVVLSSRRTGHMQLAEAFKICACVQVCRRGC